MASVSPNSAPSALVWWRRDLRLTDHLALQAALTSVGARGTVIPVYVLSLWQGAHRWTGAHRQEFLAQSLRSLAANLEAKGSGLVLREGEAVTELLRLARETGAREIFAHRDPDPFGREVERRLENEARSEGVTVHFLRDHSLLPPDAVKTGGGEPYRVFTPYAKAWKKQVIHSPEYSGAPEKLPGLPSGVFSFPQPSLERWGLAAAGAGLLPGGERAARQRLQAFLAGGILAYGERRDLPGEEATSRWSQDLRFGLVSIREVVAKCRAAADSAPVAKRGGVETFINELIWREFYFSILWHFPEVLREEFSPVFRGMAWPGREEGLRRWQEGTTGFPLVDAGMRQLRETGFMHNRVRMITAMFLTKDLHVDWREGESWFMRQLADGEISSNNGGWQWSAGTGADAAPYFRIQNPWSQTKRFDPEGIYIKRWVPELAKVAPKALQEPPEEGRSLAPGYPSPLVDHRAEREKTLEIFGNWKNAAKA
jgi:deoxyribodipyrimidine photo-lyase